MQYVNLVHLLVIFPLLGYIAYQGLRGELAYTWMYWLLAALVVAGAVYHAYRLLKR